MRIVATGKANRPVTMDMLLLKINVYTQGSDVGDCHTQALEVLSDIIEASKDDEVTINHTSIDSVEMRCVDSQGYMFMEHHCTLEVMSEEVSLEDSFIVLYGLCNALVGVVSFEGFEVKVSDKVLDTTIAMAVLDAYRAAEYECSCLVPEHSDYTIESVSVKQCEREYGSGVITLPEDTSMDAEELLDQVWEIVPMTINVYREVDVTITTN